MPALRSRYLTAIADAAGAGSQSVLAGGHTAIDPTASTSRAARASGEPRPGQAALIISDVLRSTSAQGAGDAAVVCASALKAVQQPGVVARPAAAALALPKAGHA